MRPHACYAVVTVILSLPQTCKNDCIMNDYDYDYDYDYRCLNLESSLMMTEWTFKSHKSCFTDVLPDGCRDIIVEECHGKAPILFVSELSQSAYTCLLYTSPSPRDRQKSRMPSSA